jgi:hypothetical protein
MSSWAECALRAGKKATESFSAHTEKEARGVSWLMKRNSAVIALCGLAVLAFAIFLFNRFTWQQAPQAPQGQVVVTPEGKIIAPPEGRAQVVVTAKLPARTNNAAATNGAPEVK